MKRVSVSASNFTGPFINVNGNHPIKFSSIDIIRGIISIGHSDWRSTFRGGFHRYAEILHHAFCTIAYTQEVHGNLSIVETFKDLDMSDKTPVTYRLGMGVTKLVAEKLLEVPWLLHVDDLVENGIATIPFGTRERGDLAGLDIIDRWHVLEAKGRTNKPSNRDITKGKNQAGRVQNINGLAPSTKSICMSYFQENRTDTYLIDPDNGEDKIPTEWKINKDLYIYYYYKRFLKQTYTGNVSTDNITIHGKQFPFKVFRLQHLPYNIGIYKPVYENINKESIQFIDELKELQEFIRIDNKENITNMFNSVGLDGIAIMD